MGTSVSLNRSTGRWVLDCAECGTADGTVRRRPCPVTTRRGLHYCPAAQLCGACYSGARNDGRWTQWHASCAEGAARSDAADDARESEPHMYARSARGDWAPDVPAGMVQVLTYAGTIVMVPKDSYAVVRGFGAP